MVRPDYPKVWKSPLKDIEKLSELSSELLVVFAHLWRMGDHERLAQGKNTNKPNLKSDLQKIELIYVSLQCMGQSKGYVKLEASPRLPPPNPFPFACWLGFFVCLLFSFSSLMVLRLFMLLLP